MRDVISAGDGTREYSAREWRDAALQVRPGSGPDGAALTSRLREVTFLHYRPLDIHTLASRTCNGVNSAGFEP